MGNTIVRFNFDVINSNTGWFTKILLTAKESFVF